MAGPYLSVHSLKDPGANETDEEKDTKEHKDLQVGGEDKRMSWSGNDVHTLNL